MQNQFEIRSVKYIGEDVAEVTQHNHDADAFGLYEVLDDGSRQWLEDFESLSLAQAALKDALEGNFEKL